MKRQGMLSRWVLRIAALIVPVYCISFVPGPTAVAQKKDRPSPFADETPAKAAAPILAQEVAGVLGDAKAQGLLWLGKGEAAMANGTLAEAERCFQKSVEICNRAKDSNGEFAARQGLYTIYFRRRPRTRRSK